MSLEIVKVQGANGHIATIYATDHGTVSMRSGCMSLAFTLEDWAEIYRQLGNALAYAQGVALMAKVSAA